MNAIGSVTITLTLEQAKGLWLLALTGKPGDLSDLARHHADAGVAVLANGVEETRNRLHAVMRPVRFTWSTRTANPVEHMASDPKWAQPECGVSLAVEWQKIEDRPSGLFALCKRCESRMSRRTDVEITRCLSPVAAVDISSRCMRPAGHPSIGVDGIGHAP